MAEGQPSQRLQQPHQQRSDRDRHVLLPSPRRPPQAPCFPARARSGTNSSVRAPIRASRAVQPAKARIPPTPKPRRQVPRKIIKAGNWRINAIASSTAATIAIAIEVIAFGEIRCLRYGSANTAPANDPTPTHVKTRPSWAAESCISLSAITGKSAGTIEITSEKSRFRKRIVFMRGELRA